MQKLAFLIPTTSRGRDWVHFEQSYLFEFTLKHFIKVNQENISIYIYLGIDKSDDLYNNEKILEKIKEYCRTVKVNLEIIIFDNIKAGHLTEMWNVLYKKAYEDGIDYFYQCGDDIVFNDEKWISECIKALKENNDIGVVGPKNVDDNRILTQSMVSRKHMEIFGYYFPPIIKNWYCDNWISDVYKPVYFKVLSDFSAFNNGGSERYQIVDDRPLFVDEVVKGKEIFNSYLESKNNFLKN